MINSRSNKKIKLMKSLSKKKYRDENNMFIVEGERFVNDIPSDIKIEITLVSETFYEKKNIEKYTNCEVVEDKIFDEISDTNNSQGILAVCQKKIVNFDIDNLKNSFIIIGDRLQDPGNLGTLIRTSVAAGVDYIVLSKGSVDVYNQKVIRSTASAIFNINIIEEIELVSFLKKLKEKDVEILCTHLSGKKYYFDCDFTKKIAIIIGNEGNGVCDEVSNECTELIKIPMIGEIESLNASVSSAIIMYEVLRQRL